MATTTLAQTGGLQIPVFHVDANGTAEEAAQPIVLRHSILEELYSVEQLQSLAIAKLVLNEGEERSLSNEELGDLLRHKQFPDGTTRAVAFSSGKNFFFTNKPLKRELAGIFSTQPDSACRYGSLLTSDCLEARQALQDVRIKIVDYTNPQYARYRTADCHGKISPQLAELMNADTTTPFQFRLAWLNQWAGDSTQCPAVSFVSKGTFIADEGLGNSDILLDRSSIKGLDKKRLDELLPCGDYVLPQVSLGNRSAAYVSEYNNSWQFTVHFSEEAVREDFGPATRQAAAKLAALQNDPLRLARHIVSEYDKRQAYALEHLSQQVLQASDYHGADAVALARSIVDPAELGLNAKNRTQAQQRFINQILEDPDSTALSVKLAQRVNTLIRQQAGSLDNLEQDIDDLNSDAGEWDELDEANRSIQESRMIAILRADRYGQLLEAPKIAGFMRDQVAKQWRDLAVRGGFTHSSGMAMPAPELQRGVVCIPHLPEGDVIMTRYPIINRDGIRIYRNTHSPELLTDSEALFDQRASHMMKAYSAVWLHPADAEEYHQADFDGDQMLVTPCSELPHIAKEVRRAGQGRDYPIVKQRPKVAYTDFKDEDGNPLCNLPTIAAASSRNKVGMVAMAIGRVLSSMPDRTTNTREFKQEQRALLNRLFVALQVEADHGKSAERHEDVAEIDGENLMKDVKRWKDKYPCPFFDFCKQPEAYRDYPIPTQPEGHGSVNVLAREIVNPIWERVKIREREREEFRYLAPVPEHISEAKWEKYLDWANELKVRFQESLNDIHAELGENADIKEFNKRLAQVYDSHREEIARRFKTPEQQDLAFRAVWQTQHTRPDLNARQKECYAVARKLPITFDLDFNYQLPTEALPRAEAYVLSIPFGDGKAGAEGDRVIRTKEKLDKMGIAYDAVINRRLPVVEFVLKPMDQQPDPDKTQEFLDVNLEKFAENEINMSQVPSNLWVVPPFAYTFAISYSRPGNGALAYNLFTEQICDQLQEFWQREIGVLGVTFNAYADEPFTDKRWQEPVTISVGQLNLDKSNPNYYRYHGMPTLMIGGKPLGTFDPSTPKLPIGTTFQATVNRERTTKCVLMLQPESIRLPPDLEEAIEPAQAVAMSEQRFNHQQTDRRSIVQVKQPQDLKRTHEVVAQMQQNRADYASQYATLEQKTIRSGADGQKRSQIDRSIALMVLKQNQQAKPEHQVELLKQVLGHSPVVQTLRAKNPKDADNYLKQVMEQAIVKFEQQRTAKTNRRRTVDLDR